MAGTKIGGMKAAQKNLAKDPDFYAKIGAKGGANGHTGGFAANPELARIAGARGGRTSKRTSSPSHVEPSNTLQLPHNNLSGDIDSGSIISAAGEPSIKRPSIWRRVFGGAGSANR